MKLPSLSRIPQNKNFNYIPRYYNPQKEFLEQNIPDGNLTESEQTKQRIRHSFQYKKEKKEKLDPAIIMRLWIILFFITGLASYYFNNFLPLVLTGAVYLLFRFLKKTKTRE